jgi:uncharacterized protein
MRAFSLVALLLTAAPGYREAVEQWRADRVAKLKAEDGWLSLTGLFWLKEGHNSAGSAPGSRIQLPPDAPAAAGSFVKNGGRIAWHPAGGSPRALKTDVSGAPDIVSIGRLKLNVIERGTKFGIRMKDPESPTRRQFKGLEWYPVDPRWNVNARFVPRPRTVTFDVQAGDKQAMESPGYVEWGHKGRTLRLTPVLSEGQLWFVFRDRTAGKTTYSAARFLYADPAKDGIVTVDFNKAYNPPCVFTPYATCPLPPPENRLPIAVEAGEKMYAGH